MNDLWNAQKTQLRPVIKPYFEPKPGTETVFYHWQAELNLCAHLVLDTPQVMLFVPRHALADWGVDEETAWQTAFSNLLQSPGSQHVHEWHAGWRRLIACSFESRDGYDSARLLLSPVRQVLCRKLGADSCLVAIPCRDMLLAFLPGPEARRKVLPQVARIYAEGDHPLTDRILRIDSSGKLEVLASTELEQL